MKALLLIIVVAVTLGVVFFFLTRQNQPNALQTPGLLPTVTPPFNNSELAASGSSYLDPDGIYAVLYPNEYKMDQEGDGQYTRIYKTGPSQKGQTEMYDGVLVLFEGVELNGKTLEQFVDAKIEEQTNGGVVTVTAPKQSTKVNTYPAYTFTTEGLGSAKYYIVQKDNNSKNALVVTTSVMDPTNAGFQKEVDSILNSIQLLK